jgi:DNA-binding transcriptional MerR regulator/effector-binding domain-containing protein
MTDAHLLRIGAFSRAASLSVKALRFYHEIGLLVPAAVDPVSGYRSYSSDQLIDATVIRRLRELDLPLDDVRTVLDARDPEVTGKVLAAHRAELETRLESLQAAVDELYAAVETPSLHTGAHRRREPAITALEVEGSVEVTELLSFVIPAVGRLVDAAVASGAVVDGPLGAAFPTQLDDTQEVQMFLPVAGAPLLDAATRASGVRIAELPATEVAVLLHRGSYELLEESYRELGAWVAAHAEPAELPVREHYLVGPGESDDPDEWRTEILWPLRTGGG